MAKPNQALKDLRAKYPQKTFKECEAALKRADGNSLLAEGFLRFAGADIPVRPARRESRKDAYDRVIDDLARAWYANEMNVRAGRAK